MQYKKETPFDQLTLEDLQMLKRAMLFFIVGNGKHNECAKVYNQIIDAIKFKEGKYVDGLD